MTYSSALFDTLPATPARPRRRAAAQDRPAARRRPGWARVAACSRSVPAGVNCASAPPRGARMSARSRCRPNSSAWPSSGWRPPGCPTGSKIELCDYRDVDGRYDAVMSVEMIEAVGYRFWPTYFQTLDRPGGPRRPRRDPGHHHAARPDAGHPQHPYLDPEVHLPRRPAALDRGDHRDHRAAHPAAHRRHVLAATALRRDAAAVAGTVLSQRRDALAALGFDEVFQRMWELYLAYSEAGFRRGYLDVYQWSFAPTGGGR